MSLIAIIRDSRASDLYKSKYSSVRILKTGSSLSEKLQAVLMVVGNCLGCLENTESQSDLKLSRCQLSK